MATNVTQEQILLYREGLLKVIQDGIKDTPNTAARISSKVIGSRQVYEEIVTQSGLGFFQNMDEVEGVTFDSTVPRFTKRYTPIVRTLGVKWSKQSKQKDLYGFVKSFGKQLADAAVATRNLLACNTLTLGFSGGGVLSPDGVAVFASNHPLMTGATQSNLGTLALSGSSLEDAIQQVLGQVGDRGIPAYFPGGFNLVVGPPNAGIARRAARSEGLQGTADNDTGEFNTDMIKSIIVDQMIGFGQSGLTDAWFLVPADDDRNPIFCLRVQDVETAADTDIVYQEAMFVSDFEEVWDVFGYRGMFGTNP